MPHKIKHLEGRYKTVTYALIVACEAAELQLYLFLKLHAIESHSCFPSMRTIKEQLGWSWNRVIGVMDRMRKSGRLRIDIGNGIVSVYDITEYDLINEAGFVVDKSKKRNPQALSKGERRRSQNESGSALKMRAELQGSNYKEVTTRKIVGDKSPNRIGPESVADIIRKRQTA